MQTLEERVAQMPYRSLRRRGVAPLIFLALLTVPSGASAAVQADLRVLATDGRVLADQRQYTDNVTVRTDPGADCFGPGTGGSGNGVAVRGATALGIVSDAARNDRLLRPVSISDAFSFGLGICGFGNATASGNASWYLKVNHVGSQVGGDQARLKT